MAEVFVVNLKMTGTAIRDISLTTGLRLGSEARLDARGHHMAIDVPAVMDILECISSGAITADDVRKSLGRCVTLIDERLDRQYEELVRLMETPTPRREKVRKVDRRPVYAISSEREPKIIKIGVARDVAARLKELQTASSSRLVVRWTTSDRVHRWTENGIVIGSDRGVPLEEGLHEVFSERRMSGEWFDFRDIEDPVAMIRSACADVLSDLDEWEALSE